MTIKQARAATRAEKLLKMALLEMNTAKGRIKEWDFPSYVEATEHIDEAIGFVQEWLCDEDPRQICQGCFKVISNKDTWDGPDFCKKCIRKGKKL